MAHHGLAALCKLGCLPLWPAVLTRSTQLSSTAQSIHIRVPAGPRVSSGLGAYSSSDSHPSRLQMAQILVLEVSYLALSLYLHLTPPCQACCLGFKGWRRVSQDHATEKKTEGIKHGRDSAGGTFVQKERDGRSTPSTCGPVFSTARVQHMLIM